MLVLCQAGKPDPVVVRGATAGGSARDFPRHRSGVQRIAGTPPLVKSKEMWKRQENTSPIAYNRLAASAVMLLLRSPPLDTGVDALENPGGLGAEPPAAIDPAMFSRAKFFHSPPTMPWFTALLRVAVLHQSSPVSVYCRVYFLWVPCPRRSIDAANQTANCGVGMLGIALSSWRFPTCPRRNWSAVRKIVGAAWAWHPRCSLCLRPCEVRRRLRVLENYQQSPPRRTGGALTDPARPKILMKAAGTQKKGFRFEVFGVRQPKTENLKP